MITFITENFIEIFFAIMTAGALSFCKYLHKQANGYKALLEEKEMDSLEDNIETHIEPIRLELEELRKYIRDVGNVEKSHMDLIISSYRFRLMQLCREFIKQGYMTQMQYDQLTEFYKVYHGLGGNGQAEDYYNRALKLEIRN